MKKPSNIKISQSEDRQWWVHDVDGRWKEGPFSNMMDAVDRKNAILNDPETLKFYRVEFEED
jgi:hypothetical protein